MTSRMRSDRGATAMLVALSLFLLMGMAALAVDLGSAFDDRRQQQSAADVGSLAAVQYANTNHALPAACSGSTLQEAACTGGVEAMEVVAGTLNNRFTPAQWTACVDAADVSAGYTVHSTVSDCISFTSNLQKARVVLPTTQVGTTFGRVLGIASIGITSFSEAGADINSSADVIPFALGPTGATGSQACLFANPTNNLNIAPCDGPAEGNFGFLDIRFYGNPTTGTPERCNGDTQGRLAGNIVLGSDHELDSYQAGDTIKNDVDYCPIFTAQPNEVDTQTGGSNTGIENGLFNGALGAEGRVMCKSGSEDARVPKTSLGCVDAASMFPQFLDNSPLWGYLNPSAAGQVAICNSSIATRQEMEACLSAYQSYLSTAVNPVALFDADIVDSPRFAAVPELQIDPSNGTGSYLIVGFKPVYLETMYIGCTANDCVMVHSPDETGPASCPSPLLPTTNTCGVKMNGNRNLRAMTAFILDIGMLDATITEYWPSRPGVLTFNLIK